MVVCSLYSVSHVTLELPRFRGQISGWLVGRLPQYPETEDDWDENDEDE